MLTRTSAQDYARDRVYMNSVDTGWINVSATTQTHTHTLHPLCPAATLRLHANVRAAALRLPPTAAFALPTRVSLLSALAVFAFRLTLCVCFPCLLGCCLRVSFVVLLTGRESSRDCEATVRASELSDSDRRGRRHGAHSRPAAQWGQHGDQRLRKVLQGLS